jgi:hypothetical protein
VARTDAHAGESTPSRPTTGEAIAFLLIAAGVGSFWAAAGGGRVAIIGLLLAFAGDVIRLILRVGGGALRASGLTASVPIAPFVVIGLSANEGLWRLLQMEPSDRLADALRLAAALYAVGVLWSGPALMKGDTWRRILVLQTGMSQALLLGIPLAWLIRPATLEAGRPQVAGIVALLAAAAWVVSGLRLLHLQRASPAQQVVILGTGAASGLFLGAILAVVLEGEPLFAGRFLRMMSIAALVLYAVSTTALWCVGRGGRSPT